MNSKQQTAKEQLQEELRTRRQITTPLPNRGESEDGKFCFTEVAGVTVIIGAGGGYQLPAVRTYPETGKPGETALDAAVNADVHWKKQEKKECDTGHDGPVVGTDWKCSEPTCPCKRESDIRRYSRSVK